ncbi:MAG: hypothetical protein AAF329_25955, partial [Cyanobacteria bacterium P01_A01_bin.17]
MTLSAGQLKLAESLASVFISKIDRDNPFVHKRIREWINSMPRPQPKVEGSSDVSAFEKLCSLSAQMTEIDNLNTIYGRIWPTHVASQFESILLEFRKIVDSSDVDPSIINLFFYYSSILKGSRGEYAAALNDLKKCSEILNESIKSSTKPLPRYRRNVILNIGRESDLMRRMGNVGRAIDLSDQMLGEAYDYADHASCAAFEVENKFSPIVSRALYQSCEAHLSNPDWESSQSKDAREFVFNKSFVERHYLNWTPPTLIQILTNELWGERYPEYSERIANHLYKSTSPNIFSYLLRTTSVWLGRIQIRVA